MSGDGSIALRIAVVDPQATLGTAIHDAVLLAGRLATPVLLGFDDTDYLIQPYDSCPGVCPLCADRNPGLTPTARDLRWTPHGE